MERVENGRIVECESSHHGPCDPAILLALLTIVLLLLVHPPKVPLAAFVVGLMLFAVVLVSTAQGRPSTKARGRPRPYRTVTWSLYGSWTSGSSTSLPAEEHPTYIGICTLMICAENKKVRSHCYNKTYKPID